MWFLCDFFVISREVYEKKSVICPSAKCLAYFATEFLLYSLFIQLITIIQIFYIHNNVTTRFFYKKLGSGHSTKSFLI